MNKKILILSSLIISFSATAQSLNKECSSVINSSYSNRSQIFMTIGKIKSYLLQSDWIDESNKEKVNNIVTKFSDDMKLQFPAKALIRDVNTNNCVTVANLANSVENYDSIYLDKIVSLIYNVNKKHIFMKDEHRCEKNSCNKDLNLEFDNSLKSATNQYNDLSSADRNKLNTLLESIKPKVKVGSIEFKSPKEDCISLVNDVKELKLISLNNSNIATSSINKTVWITQKDDLLSKVSELVKKDQAIVSPQNATLNEKTYGECAKVMYFYKATLDFNNAFYVNLYKSIEYVDSLNLPKDKDQLQKQKDEFKKHFDKLNIQPSLSYDKVLVEYGYKKN